MIILFLYLLETYFYFLFFSTEKFIKENKKFRDAAKREYNDTVRQLCSYIKKRDKRVIAFNVLEQEERKRKDEQDAQRRAEDIMKKKELRKKRQQEAADDTVEIERRYAINLFQIWIVYGYTYLLYIISLL